jgi:hypothetical protein
VVAEGATKVAARAGQQQIRHGLREKRQSQRDARERRQSQRETKLEAYWGLRARARVGAVPEARAEALVWAD